MSHELDPGAGVGVPAGSLPAPGSADNGGSPPPGSVGGSPTPSPESANIRQLREQYEATKRERDQWSQLGRHEDVTRSHQTYTRMYGEASKLAGQLGYSNEELQDAFQRDPVLTIATLRQMAQDTTRQPQPLTRAEAERIAEQKLKEGLKPFQQEREQRLDSEAETRFDHSVEPLFKTSFPNGLPDSNREAITGLAWSLLIENKDAYGALRDRGDTLSVQAAFDQAKKTFLKIISDYGEHEKKRVSGEPPPQNGGRPQAAKQGRSMNQIIADLNNEEIPDDVAFGRRR